MSREVTATPAGSRAGTGRQQASLRDHLNNRVAPYLKQALIEGLNNDVEFPLQWLGEHLIHLSMLNEGNPDSTNIKAHFKYNHDAPPPPPPPSAPAAAEIKTEEQPPPQESSGVSNDVAAQAEYVNGVSLPEAPVAAAEEAEVETETVAEAPISGEEELFPGVSGASVAPASEDTEMQGAP